MKAVGDGATSLARAASAQFSCHGDAAPALAAIKVKRPQRGSNFQIKFFSPSSNAGISHCAGVLQSVAMAAAGRETF